MVLKAFACDEGTLNQLQYTNGDISPGGFDVFLLCTGSASFSETTTFLSVTAPIFSGSPLFVVLDPGAFSYSAPPGACTATLSDQTFTCPSNPSTVTLDGWIIVDQINQFGIWCGSFSPPWTPSVSVPSTYVLSGLTVTLGSCNVGPSPPPPPPVTILLSDSFTESGTVSLAAHTPDTGGPWTVASGSLNVNGGQLTNPALTQLGLGLAPATTTPCTATGIYVHDTFTIPFIVVYGQDVNNLLWSYNQAGVWYLEQQVGGVNTRIGSWADVLTTGVTYKIALRAVAGGAELFRDDVLIFVAGPLPAVQSFSGAGLGLFGLIGIPVGHWTSIIATTP